MCYCSYICDTYTFILHLITFYDVIYARITRGAVLRLVFSGHMSYKKILTGFNYCVSYKFISTSYLLLLYIMSLSITFSLKNVSTTYILYMYIQNKKM